MILDKSVLNQMMIFIKSNLVKGSSRPQLSLPQRTGNLKMSVHALLVNNGKGEFGRITITAPYARFVNYGFEHHNKSKLLREDYKIVEKSIANSLKVYLAKYGGIVHGKY